MPTQTPLQALPVPLGSDNPGDIDTFFMDLATAVEKKLVQVYLDVADRDGKLTAPTNGSLVYLSGPGQLLLYTAATWVQIYPPPAQPTITSSTVTPSNTTGTDGDIHFVV